MPSSRWPAGVPCWADLAVPDLAAATTFYGAVLGWSFEDGGEEYGGYAIAQVEGAAVAGIGPQQGEMPAAWTLYLASDDVDATAAVERHGGTVLLPPGDVGPLGRMCVAADPSGAPFGVWQAGRHIGAGLVDEPGGITWEDLRSTDPDAARAFYAAVFGYVTTPLETAGPDYATFARPGSEDAPLGGMGGMTENGGSVLAPPFDTPFGRMAGLNDPAGAVFWIARTDGSRQPDRAD